MSHNQTGLRNRMERSTRSTPHIPSNIQPLSGTSRKPRRYLGNPLRLKNKSSTTACLQILFSSAIVLMYFWFTTKPSIECTSTDPLCPNKYFSNSYNEARQKFLKFSSQIHESKTYNLPIIDIKSDTEYGVKQTLYTDVTVINSNAKQSDHLIIHISGIHGIEGYVGSGIQCGILSKMSSMILNKPKTGKYIPELMDHHLYNSDKKKWFNHNEKLDNYNINDFPVVMFVHALNPYGMYYGIRANENNVDLNRNLKSIQEWKQFNKDTMDKKDDIDNFLNPIYGIKDLVMNTEWIPGVKFFRLNWVIQYVWSYIIDWYLNTKMYGYYMLRYGFDSNDIDVNKLFERYTVGQGYNSNGLQYVGGMNKERSHVVFMEFLKKQFKENKWDEQFKKITIIDIHSGFGEYGYDTLTVSDDEHLKEIHKIGRGFRIPTMIQSTHYKNERFANGIYKNVNGMSYEYMDYIVDDLMRGRGDDVDKLGLLQHFGTYQREYMLNAIRFDHSYYMEYKEYKQNMDENNDEEKRILELMTFLKEYSGDRLKNAFCVAELKWRRQVIEGGYDLFVALYSR